MAARLTTRQSENCAKAIKTTLLLKRLQDHALSETEIMASSQIRAAEILLNRTLPQLQAVQHTGDGGGPVQVAVEVRFVEPGNAD